MKYIIFLFKTKTTIVYKQILFHYWMFYFLKNSLKGSAEHPVPRDWLTRVLWYRKRISLSWTLYKLLMRYDKEKKKKKNED